MSKAGSKERQESVRWWDWDYTKLPLQLNAVGRYRPLGGVNSVFGIDDVLWKPVPRECGYSGLK
jgi:hypothetical protein